MTPAYVFDIDGTLADCSHRLHHIQKTLKDWDAFFSDMENDPPIDHMMQLARRVCRGPLAMEAVFVTGRPDKYRSVTKRWLSRYLIESPNLYMRKTGDHRDDDMVKPELIEQVRTDGFDPIMVFEDRTRVVKAIRATGIPCLQVVDGDF
jgi:phosphoglycolate phosphatase-like HAD superfamily hydrolase